MIALTAEGLATVLAALVVIVGFMAAHARRDRRTRILARYRAGERDREVRQLVADVLENCNVGAAARRRAR